MNAMSFIVYFVKAWGGQDLGNALSVYCHILYLVENDSLLLGQVLLVLLPEYMIKKCCRIKIGFEWNSWIVEKCKV